MSRTNVFLTLLFITALFGCSSSNNSIIPGMTPGSGSLDSSGYDSLPVFISDLDAQGNPADGYGILGLFELVFSDENASLVPLRKSALEDVLEAVDITNFLSLAPCTDCVKIASVELDPDGNAVVSIGIKHPFGAGDPLKPISGRNRADLHVFNVEGIVISNAAGISFPGIGATTAGLYLKNADGLTGYLDASLERIFATDATVHPYILHFDDYSAGNFDPESLTGFTSVTDPPPSGNLVMAMGSDCDYQDYIFDLDEMGNVDFIIAVGCTYAVSAASRSERFTPEYRVPQHNKKAASEVSVEILTNDLIGGDVASEATLQVKVVDINHGVPVGTELNEMRADSSVGGVDVMVPGVTSSVVNFSTTPLSGTGHDPSDPLVFEGVITNSSGSDGGNYLGIVKVTDSYIPGQNVAPLLNGMDGITRVGPVENPLVGLFQIDEFATYQVFNIEVISYQVEPQFTFTPEPFYDDIGPEGSTEDPVPTDWDVYFDASLSVGATAYDWDFDSDGTYEFVGDTTPYRTWQYAYDSAETYPVTYLATLRLNGNDTWTITHPIVVSRSIYVDGDYTGVGDGLPGSPYSTIMEGINNSVTGWTVRVDAVETGNGYYEEAVVLASGIDLVGDNWNGGTGKPKIHINSSGGWNVVVDHMVGTDVSDVKISGFDLTTNEFEIEWWGGLGNGNFQLLYLTDCSDIAVTNCKFGTTVNACRLTGILVSGGTDLMIAHNEFVNLFNTRDYNWSSGVTAIGLNNVTNTQIRHNEIHHINYQNRHNYGDAIITRTQGITCSSCSSGLQVNNNLIYDIYDLSAAAGNFMGVAGYYYYNYIDGVTISNSPGAVVANNTIDDLNPVGAAGDQAGAVWGVRCGTATQAGESIVVKNTITSNLVATEITTYPLYRGAGFNSVFTLTVDYSCVYNLDLTNGGSEYYNLAVKGTGSFDNTDNQDPNYGGPGPTFYHVGNLALVSDDGSEMGAFGGPDGDWIPPSQE